MTPTRLIMVLLKKILYSLQTLIKSVPKATTNASSFVHTLAYTINITIFTALIYASLTLQTVVVIVSGISESSLITCRRVPMNPTNTATRISELSR